MDELQCCPAHSYGWGMQLTADAPAEVISSAHGVQQGCSTWLRCQTRRLLEKLKTVKIRHI